MIALDTNILVRYFVRDDQAQAELATRLIEDRLSELEPGFVSLVVLAELVWALGQIYDVSPPETASIVSLMLDTAAFVMERPDLIAQALSRSQNELADALIHQLGFEAGCSRTVTFDRRFARYPGVELLRA